MISRRRRVKVAPRITRRRALVACARVWLIRLTRLAAATAASSICANHVPLQRMDRSRQSPCATRVPRRHSPARSGSGTTPGAALAPSSATASRRVTRPCRVFGTRRTWSGPIGERRCGSDSCRRATRASGPMRSRSSDGRHAFAIVFIVDVFKTLCLFVKQMYSNSIQIVFIFVDNILFFKNCMNLKTSLNVIITLSLLFI